MSYLVDALRKAERERHAHRDGDLYAASAGTAYATAGSRAGGPWLWLIAILVASNVALAVYVWRPRTHSAPATPMISTARVEVPATSPSPGSTAPEATRQHEIQGGGNTRLATADHDRSAPTGDIGPTPTHSSTAANPPAVSDQPSTPSRHALPKHGSVAYSRTPLAADGSMPSVDPSSSKEADRPDQASIGSVPSVPINGQLYSSVPGRSFILVGGRRYHEGERLASGPAVESIGPSGATLLYQGRRYHVSGPG